MTRFTTELEDRCRKLVRKRSRQEISGSPLAGVRREIALLLDHLDQARKRTTRQVAQWQRRQLEVGTHILNVQERVDLVPSWAERMRWVHESKRMLDQLQMETYRLEGEVNLAEQRLHGRLLELWNMHEQIAGEDGSS